MARMITCTDTASHGEDVFLTQGRQYAVLGEEAGRFLVSNDVDNHVWYLRKRFGAELTPHKWAKEIHAWADGATVEISNIRQGAPWLVCKTPTFTNDGHCQYRVKPSVDQQAIDQLKEHIAVVQRDRNDTYDRLCNANGAIKACDETLTRLHNQLINLQSGE